LLTAVLDTNVIISGVLFGGEPGKLLVKAAQREFDLLISDSMLAELTAVLQRPKFKVTPRFIEQLRNELSRTARLVVTRTILSVVKSDPEDNHILECAVDGFATHLVTGDSDLLNMTRFRKVRILTVAEFFRVLSQ